MPLKTSASTPLLGSLAGVGDVETSTPLRKLHLRPFSGAFCFRKVRSETDLQMLDKEKGLRSSVHPKNCASLKSMSREPRQFSNLRGGAHGAETEVRDLDVGTMYFGGGCGGFNGRSAGGRNDEYSHSNYNNDTDGYYRKLLEANPGDPLLLRNYAQYLHEVKHDVVKAEEFYERAMIASPGDGDVLAMYAKLVWEAENDPERAEIYFDRAVQAAPDDCYVLASHANFLWNTEEEEDEEGVVGRCDKNTVGYEHFSGPSSTNVAAAYC